MTEKHPFSPTLTLKHHESGWDGTFSAMLHEMAGVLDDGPVDASLKWWDGERKQYRFITGAWIEYDNWNSVTFADQWNTVTVETENIEELSI